jgi:hypothetical protein
VKITPEAGGVRLKLSSGELTMLAGMLDDLLADLRPGALDAADPVRERLYPSGYSDGDPRSERMFRDLTEASLRDERTTRAELCRAETASRRPGRWAGTILLDPEAAERWTQVLNDMRLTLGTRLGVTDDMDYRLNRHDPQLRERARYVWLTALQDLLVQTLLG